MYCYVILGISQINSDSASQGKITFFEVQNFSKTENLITDICKVRLLTIYNICEKDPRLETVDIVYSYSTVNAQNLVTSGTVFAYYNAYFTLAI